VHQAQPVAGAHAAAVGIVEKALFDTQPVTDREIPQVEFKAGLLPDPIAGLSDETGADSKKWCGLGIKAVAANGMD
jgi:hypothetical protein